MEARSYDFFWGMKVFSRAFAKVWLVPELRAWYLKTLIFTVMIALFIIVGFFALGTWAFASYFETVWSTAAAVLLWAIALFYLAGYISLILVNILVLFVGGESALTRHYFKERATEYSLKGKEKIKEMLKDRSREIFSIVRSVLVAVLAWPLLIFPVTMPLGVLIFSWVMAGDALIVARRLCHEKGILSLQDKAKLPVSAQMGMAVLPSSLALMPVLGWTLLPILQVAGIEAQVAFQDSDQ